MATQLTLSKFEILRPGQGNNMSGIMPSTAQPVGRFLRVTAVDPDSNQKTFGLVTNLLGADGILTRSVRTTFGLTDTEQLFGFTSPDGDGETTTPFTVSVDGSIEPIPAEFIVEGVNYLQTDTVNATQITNALAVNTALSFTTGGVLGVAATADFVQYRIRKQLTITDSTVTASQQVRLQIYRVGGGYFK